MNEETIIEKRPVMLMDNKRQRKKVVLGSM